MKIGIFTNNFRPFVGGVTRSIETFMREFENKGHDVHVFAPRFEGYKEDEKTVYRVPAIPRFNHTDFSLPLPFSLRVRSIFDKLDLDLVHVQHPFFLGEMGMHLGKNRGLPIVLTYHTQYEKYSHYAPIDSDLVKRWIVNVCTSFCNLCDLVVAPSHDMRDILISREVKTRIEVIPTGVDLSSYQSLNRQWLRKEFGIDEKKQILVHVGRLAKEKNLDFLFGSVANIMKKNKEILFFIAGEGDQKDRLRALAGRLGIQDQVIFHGKMTPEELVNAYAGGDLFIFCSKTETQGLVVLEAMAAGMPVVAVDAPGIRDIVAHGVSGFLTAEDTHEFSEKILILLQSAEKKDAFSKASLKIAEELSSSRMADRMLQEYSRLLQQSPDTLNPEIHRFKILKGLLQEALRKKG
jgi:glycosyltransferase involved in cell wall biosynthesis